MIINARTAISTSKILLVPYEASHVTRYHDWMKDPEIQEATASEPLSLEEEYAMQQSWRNDHDKLTFIACLPIEGERAKMPESGDDGEEYRGLTKQMAGQDDKTERMVGDVNLFLSRDGEDETRVDGELELMIADLSNRRRGLGRSTILTFLCYLQNQLPQILAEYSTKESMKTCELGKVKVKIGVKNVKSIKLFESIGFVKIKEEPNYFGELELTFQGNLEKGIGDMMMEWKVEDYREFDYDRGDDS